MVRSYHIYLSPWPPLSSISLTQTQTNMVATGIHARPFLVWRKKTQILNENTDLLHTKKQNSELRAWEVRINAKEKNASIPQTAKPLRSSFCSKLQKKKTYRFFRCPVSMHRKQRQAPSLFTKKMKLNI